MVGINDDGEKSVEELYQEFWKDIVENEDGTLNIGQVKKELSDYSMIMDNCAMAYTEMSCGNISKPNTYFSEVKKIFEENFLHWDYVRDDVRDMIKNTNYREELIEELIEYFDLKEEE